MTAGPSSSSVTASGTAPGTNQNASSQASAGTASAVGGGVIQQSGPGIPSLDPVFATSAQWAHATTPQSNSVITGTNSVIQTQDTSSFALQKGFLTGTIVSLGLNNSSVGPRRALPTS